MAANGAVPNSQLVFVQGPIQLAPQTAQAYRDLKAAAARAGENLDIWTPAGGYRSLAVQRDMIARPLAYNINPKVQLAAPGNSTHGQGRTVDLLGRRAWVKANAPRYGFAQRDSKNDPDCWTHGDYMQTETPSTAGNTTNPIEDDMPLTAKEMQDIAYNVWAYTLTNVNGNGAVARATDLLWATANEQTSIARYKDTLAAINKPVTITIDPAPIVAAVQAAIADQGVVVDTAVIAVAVKAALAEDFNKVNANINDQPTEFILSPKE